MSIQLMVHCGCPDVIRFSVMFTNCYWLWRGCNRWRQRFHKAFIITYLAAHQCTYDSFITLPVHHVSQSPRIHTVMMERNASSRIYLNISMFSCFTVKKIKVNCDAHLFFLAHWARRWVYHWVCDVWPVRRQTYSYLPSHKASPPFGRYQIILLGEWRQRHMKVNNLPGVVTWKWTSQESNPRLVDCKSNAITITRHATRSYDKWNRADVEMLPTSMEFGLWNVGMTTSGQSCRSGISSCTLTDDTRDRTRAPNNLDDWRLPAAACYRDKKPDSCFNWFQIIIKIKTYNKTINDNNNNNNNNK